MTRHWSRGSSQRHLKHLAHAPHETVLVAACLVFLRQQGCLAWRMNVGGAKFGRRFVRFGVRGMADILAVKSGRAIFVECKRHPNAPTIIQEEFLQDVREHGALSWVVYSVEELERQWQEVWGCLR